MQRDFLTAHLIGWLPSNRVRSVSRLTRIDTRQLADKYYINLSESR